MVRVEDLLASAGLPAEVERLVAITTEADGHKPLDEHALAELKAGPQEMPHAAFLARLDHEPAGYAHLSYRETRHGWRLDFFTAPQFRRRGVGSALLQHVCDHVAADGGGTLHAWTAAHRPQVTGTGKGLGFKVGRRLHLQHRALPAPEQQTPEGVVFRTLPSSAYETWLNLHNRVFADHPDASNWSAADLKWRTEEPWFDPEGFRAAYIGQDLVAYCWMKMHDHPDAGHDGSGDALVGEIYMLGVDPTQHGSGLADAIAVEGLSWAYSKGAPKGMLYVDESNASAMALYARLGFQTGHVDTCMEIEVPPLSPQNAG